MLVNTAWHKHLIFVHIQSIARYRHFCYSALLSTLLYARKRSCTRFPLNTTAQTFHLWSKNITYIYRFCSCTTLVKKQILSSCSHSLGEGLCLLSCTMLMKILTIVLYLHLGLINTRTATVSAGWNGLHTSEIASAFLSSHFNRDNDFWCSGWANESLMRENETGKTRRKKKATSTGLLMTHR